MGGAASQADALPAAARSRLDSRRAERRGAHHLAVELSGAAQFRAYGGRDRRRQLRVHETIGAVSAHQRRDGGPHRTVHGPAGVPRGSGRTAGDDKAAGAAVQSHLLHRRRKSRFNSHGRRREASHTGHFGARRQVAGVRRPYREPRRRRAAHRLGAVHQRRADLRGTRLCARNVRRHRAAGRKDRRGRHAVLRLRPATFRQFRTHHQRPAFRPADYAAARSEEPRQRTHGMRGQYQTRWPLHRTDRAIGRQTRCAGDAGGDIRPDSAHFGSRRREGRSGIHQRPATPAGGLRVHGQQEGTADVRARSQLRSAGIQPAAWPSDLQSAAVRRRGSFGHGLISRQGRVPGVQSCQDRGRQARGAGYAFAGVSAV